MIVFLRDELRDDKVVFTTTFEEEFLRILRWNCFNSRLITLSDEGWKKFKEIDEELYNTIQHDV